MREVEVLVELKEDISTALQKLQAFDYKGEKHTLDTYYYDPLRPDLHMTPEGKLFSCCRLRKKDGKSYITYKTDYYDKQKWLYSDEHESEVTDLEALKKIFDKLGLQKLVTVENTKHTYITPDYEIVIEEVKDLGLFLEVEALHDQPMIPVAQIKQKIYDFIEALGLSISPELNSGKPELLLKKKKI